MHDSPSKQILQKERNKATPDPKPKPKPDPNPSLTAKSRQMLQKERKKEMIETKIEIRGPSLRPTGTHLRVRVRS